MVRVTRNVSLRRSFSTLAATGLLAAALVVGSAGAASAADGIDPGPPNDPYSNIPAGGPNAVCGTDDLGRWIKFTSGGPNSAGEGEAQGTGSLGSSLAITYTAVEDTDGTVDFTILTLIDTSDGEAKSFEGLIGQAGSPTYYWDFAETVAPSPVLDTLADFNFSQFAVCTFGLVLPPESISVSKTATTSFTRTHAWDVTKTVDTTSLLLYGPGQGASSGTLNWVVTVGYLGATDSAPSVSGSITVLNDGLVDATVTGVTDQLFGTTAAPVTCPQALPVVLAPTESLVCTYSVALAAKTDGTNVATVTTEEDTYTGSAAVTFGAPTTVVNGSVTLTDVSSVSGTQTQTFTAPTGGMLKYSSAFSWTAPGCRTTNVTNTATLASGSTTLGSASTTSVVKEQCFQGDTAWAAGSRYVRKGNWATYVDARSLTTVGSTKTVSLLAGQTKVAGEVVLTQISASQVAITVTLKSPWVYAGVADNLKVQSYSSAPSLNPSPGLFAYKTTCNPGTLTCTIVVPDASFYGIHLDVGRWLPLT